jgi:dihydrofolate reductase
MSPIFAVFIATSLDGFIARQDGSIDWLDRANALVPQAEDCGYEEFMSTVDGLVMGRGTFEQVLAFEQWPYGDTPVYVLSRTLDKLPETVPSSARLVSGSPSEVASMLASHGHRRLYLDGGVTIQRFLAAGLVAELTVTTVPVLIGRGRPLFGPLTHDVRLRHLATRAYPFGFVQSRYAVVGAA